MSAEIVVYSSWFIFAVWAYIVLIYVIGFLVFARIKTKNTFYDRKALFINLVLFLLNLSGQIFTIYLYLHQGKQLMKLAESTTIEYWILVSINLFLIICYLVFFLLFSNNLAVKMTGTKLYLPGMSVLNSAFVKAVDLKNGGLILEYVYKHEARKKWIEKLKFYHFFPSTLFIKKNYLHFFDPGKNLAFFDLHEVTKDKEDGSQSNITDATVKGVVLTKKNSSSEDITKKDNKNLSGVSVQKNSPLQNKKKSKL